MKIKITNLIIALVSLLVISVIIVGVFAYEWLRAKGELAKQIKENASLTKQIETLQKEIEGLKTTKTWKTYRNEYYGFEIDYPTIEWEFKGGSGSDTFYLAKQLSKEQEKTEEKFYRFYIFGEVLHLYPECYSYSWEEIMENAYKCFLGSPSMNFEKEIATDFGVKGYKGKGGGVGFGRIRGVFFPLSMEEKLQAKKFYLVLLIYYDLDTHYTQEEIRIFDKVISTFRFIEK